MQCRCTGLRGVACPAFCRRSALAFPVFTNRCVSQNGASDPWYYDGKGTQQASGGVDLLHMCRSGRFAGAALAGPLALPGSLFHRVFCTIAASAARPL